MHYTIFPFLMQALFEKSVQIYKEAETGPLVLIIINKKETQNIVSKTKKP